MSLQEEYKDYCKKFKSVWKYLQSCSENIDVITNEICQHRLYFGSFDKWKNIFSEVGIIKVSEKTCDYNRLKDSRFSDLALFSEDGYFLLNERYVFPIKDMSGNIIALVGWYPDSKRYITTPSKFFSKDCLFFGMEQLGKTGLGKDYFVVEGIFDSLTLRALGYNAISMMGINTSKIKISMYGLFRRLVGIPDNDKQGRKVLVNDLWKLPSNASYLKWVGGIDDEEGSINIKDIDNLCNLFEEGSVKYLFDEAMKNKSRVIKVEI